MTIPRSFNKYTLPSDQLRIALQWNGTFSTIGSGTFVAQNFGIASPGLNLPKYWAQYFGIYKYAVIEKVTLTLEVANIGGRPMRVVLAESNTQDVTPTDYLELSETPHAVARTVIPAGNHSVVTLKRSTSAAAIMGHKVEDDEAWWNTVAGPPAAPIQPLLVVGFEPILAATTIDYTHQVRIIYDVKFFTLNHL